LSVVFTGDLIVSRKIREVSIMNINTHKVSIEAYTIEDAKSKLKKNQFILSVNEIDRDNITKIIGIGKTIEDAYTDAHSKVPPNSKIISKDVVKNPGDEIIEIQEYSEELAKESASLMSSNHSIIKEITLVNTGKKGVLGIGKKRNTYKVKFENKAVTEIKIKEKSKFEFSIIEDDSKELISKPIDRERMDLLWINPDELDVLEIALQTKDSVPVMLGPEKGGPKELSVTKKDIKWAKSLDKISEKASTASSRGDYNKAIDYYKEALKLAPSADIYLMSLGACYGNLKQPDKALPYLLKAHDLSPNNQRISQNLSTLKSYIQNKSNSRKSASTPQAITNCPQCGECDYTFLQKIDGDQAAFACNGCLRKRGQKVAIVLRKSDGDWI